MIAFTVGDARAEWARDLGESLRGPDASFQLREARYQAIPELLRAWSNEADAGAVVLGLKLGLARGRGSSFPLKLQLVAGHDADASVPIEAAWDAGPEIELGGQSHEHPAHQRQHEHPEERTQRETQGIAVEGPVALARF